MAKKKQKKPFVAEIIEESGCRTNINQCSFPTEKEAHKYINANLIAFDGEHDKRLGTLNKNKSAISKKQFNELRTSIPLLPSKHLLEKSKTEDAVKIWACLNWRAKYVSKCLSTRLFRYDGDPIRHLLFDTKFDRLQYQLIWGTVDFYDSLLSIINIIWEPLHSYLLSHGYYRIRNGFQLLLIIITNCFDGTFQTFLQKDFKISPSQQEKLFNAAAKHIYRQQVPLTAREERVFNSHSHDDNTWVDLILDICEREIQLTNNPILVSRLKDFYYRAGVLSDYVSQFLRHMRKEGAEVFEWKDQTHLRKW